MNGDQLLKVADAGLLLTSTDKDNDLELLNVLLSIEDTLDQGRGLVFDSPELKQEINKKMDELRKRIRDILDTMEHDSVRQFLSDRGERLKTQFSI
jgi:hypothetical protein